MALSNAYGCYLSCQFTSLSNTVGALDKAVTAGIAPPTILPIGAPYTLTENNSNSIVCVREREQMCVCVCVCVCVCAHCVVIDVHILLVARLGHSFLLTFDHIPKT